MRVVLVLAALLVLVVPAQAATVSLDRDCYRYGCSITAVFAAAPGERNALTITRPAFGVVVLHDAGAPLDATSGCVALDQHTARCSDAIGVGDNAHAFLRHTSKAMPARKPRPAIDERIDRELSRRLDPRQHRYFWCAEAPALGGMTPYEALLAGEREAVLELAMGRPGADTTIRLISSEEGERMRAALGPVRPPYEL